MGKLGRDMVMQMRRQKRALCDAEDHLKENGLRLLLLGGLRNPATTQILLNIKKGPGRTDIGRRPFSSADWPQAPHQDSRATFISWLCRARLRKQFRKTIEYAKEINPLRFQVSLAAPYPGTTLLQPGGRERNGWKRTRSSTLVS